MQLNVLQSAGRRTDAGQLRRSKVHRAHRSRATPCVDALGRKPPHATEPPGTARRYLTRSRATPCVDAFRRHPPHASKPPGMARRYLNRSRATPCVDALRTRQPRRAAGHGPALPECLQDRSRAQNNQAAFRRPDAHSRSHDQKKIAYRINSGIGTPNSQSRIIFMAGLLAWNAGYRSRRRPPQVALRLAKNAPISRVMNSHSAA